MSRSSITKEFECAGRENKVRIHIGSNDSYLDVCIVSLADWYLAILITFITEKDQFK